MDRPINPKARRRRNATAKSLPLLCLLPLVCEIAQARLLCFSSVAERKRTKENDGSPKTCAHEDSLHASIAHAGPPPNGCAAMKTVLPMSTRGYDKVGQAQDPGMGLAQVFIAGAGFLADAYDLFVINIAVDLMDKETYGQPLTNNMKATIKTMALVGAVVGQIGRVFG